MTDPTRKAELVRCLVARVPLFAPAWNDLANTLNDEVDKLAAIEKGLAASPDAETKGMLLINRALALNKAGHRDGAAKLLGELASDSEATFRTGHLAKALLPTVARNQ